MFSRAEVGRDRHAAILYIWRLIGAVRGPLVTPSEWTGWQVVNPEGERQRYVNRAAEGRCTRCGGSPLASKTLCTRCRERQRRASAKHRRRRGPSTRRTGRS